MCAYLKKECQLRLIERGLVLKGKYKKKKVKSNGNGGFVSGNNKVVRVSKNIFILYRGKKDERNEK